MLTSEEEKEFGILCPVCKEPWSFTARIVCSGNWVYCDTCKRKAEHIVKENKEKLDKEFEDKYGFSMGSLDWGHRK